jgi:hypothetical protein
MSPRIPSFVAALLLCGAVAFAAPAGARAPAKTKVTIQAESGGFFGYVFSPKPQKCANNRVVKLYKQKGAHQSPSTDPRIGSDIAQPNGDRFMWSTGNTGFAPGKFYARAGRTTGCKADSSKSIPAEH